MAGQPYIYNGQGFSLLRDKNRFVLPNVFRPTVRDSSGKDVVYLTAHDRWPCLVGFGYSRILEFKQEIREKQEFAARTGNADFDAEKLAADMYASYDVPFDGSGRFVLPEDLAAIGEVTDQLYFRGNGDYFTLWAPEQLYATDGWKAAQAACRSLAAKELAKAAKK